METGTMLFMASGGLLLVLISPKARMVAAALVVVGLLAGAYMAFVRSTSCEGPCRVPMSPTWAAATCWSSPEAAVLKQGGRYWLVSDADGDTWGACLDWRFFKSHTGTDRF